MANAILMYHISQINVSEKASMQCSKNRFPCYNLMEVKSDLKKYNKDALPNLQKNQYSHTEVWKWLACKIQP